MKVVILCGGRGTRLREETEYRPKPMVPVGGLPILWHIMKLYAYYGHKEFILCLGYKGDMIKDFFRNYQWHRCDITLSLGPEREMEFHDRLEEEDWRITLAETGLNSMTAYRIRQIRRFIPEGEDFLLTYGDGVSDINIEETIKTHRQFNKVCTISAVHPAGRFGHLVLEDDGTIKSFREKPQTESVFVNGGFMVCRHDLFDYLPDDPGMMFENKPIADITAAGQLHAYRHSGFWQPMDTYQEMTYLNQLWDEGRAPWKVWG
jgi:glucose-1-phosphate cytidylyltransferase